jgi:hypothetical protein
VSARHPDDESDRYCQGRSKSGPLTPVEKWTTRVSVAPVEI